MNNRLEIVHLILCRLRSDDAQHLPDLFERLDESERERASRFVFERDCLAYAAAHALLRHAMDVVAGPQAWRFVADEFGKPLLAPPFNAVRFSLTHTDGLVAVALAHGLEVGVDAEHASRDLDEDALISLALAPEEIADLDCFSDRRRRLLQLWVAKEALAKALGLGLALPINQVALRGDPPGLWSLPTLHGPVDRWWMKTEILDAHWVSLATRGSPSRVQQRTIAVEEILTRGFW